MPTTSETIATAQSALNAAAVAALQDSQTIGALRAALATAQASNQPGPPMAEPVGPIVLPNGIMDPKPFTLPASAAHIDNDDVSVVVNTDYAGTMFTQKGPAGFRPVFKAESDNIAISNFKALTDKTQSGGVLISKHGVTIEKSVFLDGSGNCITVRGDNAYISQMMAGKFSGYAIYVEKRNGTIIEDLAITGGSDVESCIRAAGAGTISLKRVRIDYTATSRKACFRGDAKWTLSHVTCIGAQSGANILGGGDGGRGLAIDRVITDRVVMVSNPDETRAAVMAAVAAGEKNDMALAHVFLKTAKVPVDPADASKGVKPLAATEEQLAYTVAERRRVLPGTATLTAEYTHLDYGYSVEPASDNQFDATCIIDGTKGNGSPISVVAGTYPEARTDKDVGWQLPYDVIRKKGLLTLSGTKLLGTGKTVVFGMTDEAAREYVRGHFTYNGVAMNW